MINNGGEFINKKFKRYCKSKDIILIHGKAWHPQAQGTEEIYYNTIKDYTKIFYAEWELNDENFNLKLVLKQSLEIYNNTKHITTGFSRNFIFNSTDEKLFDKIKTIL